ncbi:MAG: T9SS C-terminal target domain-containing protein [Saprospirales bacterium]|nr:MAG: T9SS C-terminal target domain-containing protein [Saprospirales bacterium]
MNSTIVLFVPFFSLLWCFSIEAQHLKTVVDFSQYTEEYKELEEASLLTSANQAWGEMQWIMQLEPTIYFPGTEDRPFNQLGVSTLGQIALWHNTSPDNIELDLYLVPFGLNVVSPLQDYMNDDQGTILYMMGEDFIKVEFRNVALAVENILNSGRLLSRINYTVEIDLVNDRVRFLYGPSEISSALQSHFSNSGIIVGLAFEVWQAAGQQFSRTENFWKHLKGSAEDFEVAKYQELVPSTPDPAFLSFPPEGTVYEFSFSMSPTSVQDYNEKISFRIYPNPGSDKLFIDLSASELINPEIEIFDILGLSVYHSAAADKTQIDTSDWSAGIYYVRIRTGDKTASQKWLKH